MDQAEKRPVHVTILSQSYTILTKGEPREVERLAQRVDQLMHEIARMLPNADSTKIAVLACLHMADQLNDLENNLKTIHSRIERKTQELGLLLEQVMESSNSE